MTLSRDPGCFPIGRPLGATDDHAMTSDGRLLRRRTTDRVLVGVAGGLGDYFNVDPLLIRIAFVGLMVFGGAGFFLYVAAWLLIPAAGQETSILEGMIRRLGISRRGIGWIVVAVVVFAIIANLSSRGVDLTTGQETIYLDPAALWALVIIVAGIYLIGRRGTAPSSSAPTATSDEASAVVVPAVAVPAAPARPRSPLAWYTLASILIAIGLLAIASNVGHLEIGLSGYFGIALALIGIGLVIGAWWGRARILILLAILLVPVALTASFVTAPLEGGFGDYRYAPANAAELQTEYRATGGRLVLDLTDLSLTGTVHIAASVALGELRVILPDGASVQIDSRVGAGSAIIFDERDDGTSLADRYVRKHPYTPTFILDLESGIGVVEVDSRSAGVY